MVAFAVADAGFEDLGVQLGEGQVLTQLTRLRQHQLDVLERLACPSFRREIAAHHLRPLRIHHLRVGGRLPRDVEKPRRLEPHALGEHEPLRERQAVEAEDQIDGKLGAAGIAGRPHVEIGRKHRAEHIRDLGELGCITADQSHAAALPDLLAGSGDRRIEEVQSPRARRARASAAMRSGSQVLAQRRILPEPAPSAGRRSRSTTSSTCSVLNTARNSTSHWRATSAGEAAAAPPSFSRLRSFSASMSKPDHAIARADQALGQGTAHQAQPDNSDLLCKRHAMLVGRVR